MRSQLDSGSRTKRGPARGSPAAWRAHWRRQLCLHVPLFPAEGEFLETPAGVQRQGHGSFSDGAETYTGSWEADEMSGRGEYRGATGATYAVSGAAGDARTSVRCSQR